MMIGIWQDAKKRGVWLFVLVAVLQAMIGVLFLSLGLAHWMPFHLDKEHPAPFLIEIGWECAFVSLGVLCLATGFFLVISRMLWLRLKNRTATIERQSLLFKVLLEINSQIIARSQINRIFETICEGVVQLGYALCGVAIPREDGRIEPVASRGFRDGYADSIKVRWDGTPEGQGPGGRAVRSGAPVVVKDTESDESFRLWKDVARKYGYRSAACVPMKNNSEVVGIIAVYSEKPNDFSKEEINLLTSFAQQATVALMHAHALEQMRSSEERFRSIVETASEGIFLVKVETDGTCRYVLANPVVNLVSGRDVTYKTPHEAFPRVMAEALTERYRRVAETGQNLSDERSYEIRGEKRYFRAVLNPIRDSTGKVILVRGMFVETTAIRNLERQLALSQRLEAVGTLAGGIAHDFNNALSVIFSYGHMLRPVLAHDLEAASDLDQMLKAAESAAAITRQLLAFSRRQILEPVPMDFNQTVNNLLEFIRKIIGENIRLETKLDADLDTIVADVAQVEQILMNLCINARDSMPGGGRLLVQTRNVEFDDNYVREQPFARPGRYTQLVVSDTGVGMSPEVTEHIFEPFFTTKEHGKGSGLGLAMVYGIVKQHNGFIHVYSQPGRGTTFNIYFPSQPGLEIHERKETRAPVRGGNESLLVAEDELMVRQMYERILPEFGYKINLACDGIAAVKAFREKPGEFDMVILDAIMPNMSGLEAYREMKKQYEDLKVLFVSGYPFESFDEPPLIEKDKAFLQKPFGPDELARKIREVLDGKRL